MTDTSISPELTDPHHLKLLGHGTDGSDGVETGIHLRWSFNHKLGFPNCIRLFRRRSFLQNRYVWDLNPAYNRLPVPSTHPVPNGVYPFEYDFTSTPGVQSFPIISKTFDTNTDQVVYIQNGELHIAFSGPVDRIELGFLVRPEADFQIIVEQGGETYYPQRVLGSFTGWQDIYFDAPGATGLTLQGKEIDLFHLAVWLCSDVEANPWQEIKLTCGCGLPVIPSDKPTPEFIDGIVPVIDPAKINCRLGPGPAAAKPFTRDDILDISNLLLDIFHEGSTVPHGWTLFESEPGGIPEEGEAAAEVSIYDYLLAQTLHVPVAKVFDLYFVDRPGNPDIYFDYRIETMWPEWNMRQLDCEITFDSFEIHQRFDNLFNIEALYFLDVGSPEIVEAPNALARTNLGLALSDTIPFTVFRFLQPVTEVQLWLLNSDPTRDVIIEAYQDYHVTRKDKRILQGTGGVVRLHGDQIDSIRIYGGDVILSRVHYDPEPAPYFWQQTMICGVKRGTHPYPLEKPFGLEASLMPGGPVNKPDLTYAQIPHLVGLRWEANEDPDIKLMSHHPFAFHIQRGLNTIPSEVLTQNSPLLISPETGESSTVQRPEGWPQERQYYVDNLETLIQYFYGIQALDLFGRQSPLSELKTFQIELPPPPPPANVTAHFLDYSSYDPGTDTFTDPNLLAADKDWLRNNRTSAVVVRWQWTAALAAQVPEANMFHIYLQEGWLNTYAGTISSTVTESTIAKSSLNLTLDELSRYPLLDTYTDIPCWTFQVTLNDNAQFDADVLRLCWLRQNNAGSLVLTNTSGAQPTLSVLKFEEPFTPLPLENQGVSLSVTPDQPAFIDYSLVANWEGTSLIQYTQMKLVQEDYTVYIPSPPFPGQPVTLDEPIRYGQVGVCTSAGSVRGGVSTPATIMAVYQNPPNRPAPALLLAHYKNMQALNATPADAYGKSTFHIRWRKSGSDSVQHFVYRAIDTSLFLKDNARRKSGDLADYSPFETAKYNPADLNAIKQISYTADVEGALSQYANLTPSQLFILANMKENESAYTRLHSQPIYEGDSDYQDRDTNIPDPVDGTTYTTDDNLLLYSDASLDGRGTNRYFYRIKTTASNGLSSEFSESTRPVECPRTTPPPRPIITSITGGEKQIAIKWAKNPGAAIAGYLLYRAQDKHLASDWRRMELIKSNETDTFTVEINGVLPPKQFEYVDDNILPRQQYFYAVVAVGLSDDGKWLKSVPSLPKASQAFDLTPPDPPVSVSASWDSVRSVIHLQWSTRGDIQCEVRRYARNSDTYFVVSETLAAQSYNDDEDLWLFEWEDANVQAGETQKYIVRVINDIRLSAESAIIEVET